MIQKEYQEYTRDYQKPFQEQNNATGSKDFVIGALIGGVVGAATALFMAPKPGKELRSNLNVQVKNLGDKTEKLRQAAMEKGGTLAETAREKRSAVTEMVTNRSADLMDKVKNMKQNGGDSDSSAASDSGVGSEFSAESTADDYTAADMGTETADASSSSSTTPGKNAAQLKLDETKKAFEETEKRYN
ncbi:YtxH domain-containing protein [Peribacillus glennii]|uniref:YtxH domain-containing protein n=1 Tax=Peribacillus glennii TaxID=2303991 RepID=A0A372LJF8_9BACI|nr:YtxH domain-containing protein [Peribacillus glennii]RFU66251.1 YtxH domain-containing protein [Peribacillus glennii]